MRAAAARELELARRGWEVQLATAGNQAEVSATGQEETKTSYIPYNVSSAATTTDDHINQQSETSTELAPVDALF